MGKCIGIDIGYGFTKTYTDGLSKIFPTAVTAAVPQKTFGEIKYILANGEKYLVGNDAEREGLGLIDTRTSGFITSNAWQAVFGQALKESCFIPDHSVIVLGVPPIIYTQAYAENIVICVKNSKISVNGDFDFDLENTTVKVIPQGAGNFFSYFDKEPEGLSKNVAVLDIGHHTIDMICFSNGRYVESYVQTIPMGTSVILDGIIKAFHRKFHFSVRYSESMKLLRDKSLTSMGTEYHLPEVSEIAASYGRQVSSFIDNYFEKLPAIPDVGIAGGGGILLLNGLIKLKRKLCVVNLPEMANAYGDWLYGSRMS